MHRTKAFDIEHETLLRQFDLLKPQQFTISTLSEYGEIKFSAHITIPMSHAETQYRHFSCVMKSLACNCNTIWNSGAFAAQDILFFLIVCNPLTDVVPSPFLFCSCCYVWVWNKFQWIWNKFQFDTISAVVFTIWINIKR